MLEWCQQAFESLIEKLTSSPVVNLLIQNCKNFLHTDASTTGLGVALYQEQTGVTCVITYACRCSSRSESRYPAYKFDFLALKWAKTDKFHDHLYGNTFTVITDNNPLTYLPTTAKLDAAKYSLLAKYRAGKHNFDADTVATNCQKHTVLMLNDLSSFGLLPCLLLLSLSCLNRRIYTMVFWQSKNIVNLTSCRCREMILSLEKSLAGTKLLANNKADSHDLHLILNGSALSYKMIFFTESACLD